MGQGVEGWRSEEPSKADRAEPSSVPLVLQVKSQRQLEVKLDCSTLMGPTKGIMEVHINLENMGRGENQTQ